MNNNIPWYLLIITLFVLLKFSFSTANNDDILFLLQPINKLVGFLTGYSSVYSSETGFYYSQLNVLIDKSCSGFNFGIVCFIMLSTLFVRKINRVSRKIIAISTAFICSYIFAVFVTASRIYISIIVQRFYTFFPKEMHSILHQIIGVLTSLVFLIFIYYLTEKFLTKKQQYAKLA